MQRMFLAFGPFAGRVATFATRHRVIGVVLAAALAASRAETALAFRVLDRTINTAEGRCVHCEQKFSDLDVMYVNLLDGGKCHDSCDVLHTQLQSMMAAALECQRGHREPFGDLRGQCHFCAQDVLLSDKRGREIRLPAGKDYFHASCGTIHGIVAGDRMPAR